jgi:hypothetical protein
MRVGGGVAVHIAKLILNLALGGRLWSISHLGRFIPGKEPECLLNGRLDGPHSAY